MPSCLCAERARPLPTCLAEGSNERPRQWFVLVRNESRSAFNGYAACWSDYSLIHCRVCGASWRTRGAFVGGLDNCEFFPERNPPQVLATAE